MKDQRNNHTTALLVLIGVTAAISIIMSVILWFAGTQVFSYTESFATDMTQYDGTGVVDGYAVIADTFGVLGSAFAAILIYAIALVATIYAIWAIVFIILNWALRLSYIGIRIVNTIYSLPALAGGFGVLLSGKLTGPSVYLGTVFLLYGGIILFLAYTSRVICLENRREGEENENSKL